MKNGKSFTVGHLAKELGICTETIRYYHRIGLLPTPVCLQGRAVRLYAEKDLRLLQFIKRAQRLGFSLDEIRALIAFSTGSHCDEVRSFAAQKLADLKQRMAELAQMHDIIEQLLHGCNDSTSETQCPFITALLHDNFDARTHNHSARRPH